jgi:hypothetical protein
MRILALARLFTCPSPIVQTHRLSAIRMVRPGSKRRCLYEVTRGTRLRSLIRPARHESGVFGRPAAPAVFPEDRVALASATSRWEASECAL